MKHIDPRIRIERKSLLDRPDERLRGVLLVAAREEYDRHALSLGRDYTIHGHGSGQRETGGKDRTL